MGKAGKIAAGVGVAAGLAAGAYGIDRKLKREKARKEIANKLYEIYLCNLQLFKIEFFGVFDNSRLFKFTENFNR